MDLYYEAADRHGPARIAVTSVQGLASQNLDEMSEFTTEQSKSQLKNFWRLTTIAWTKSRRTGRCLSSCLRILGEPLLLP